MSRQPSRPPQSAEPTVFGPSGISAYTSDPACRSSARRVGNGAPKREPFTIGDTYFPPLWVRVSWDVDGPCGEDTGVAGTSTANAIDRERTMVRIGVLRGSEYTRGLPAGQRPVARDVGGSLLGA